MAKDPADRYQSTAHMASDIGAAAPAETPAQTEAVPAAERTELLPVSPDGPASTAPLPETVQREARRRWSPLIAAAAALAILGVALALTLGTETPLPTASPTSPPSSPSPSPTESPPPIPTVDIAFARFGAALERLDPDVQEELLERANEALSRYADAEQEDALERLAEVRQKVEELIVEGAIPPQDADLILGAVAGLEASMQAFPAPSSDESGSGQGKGKGKAKGRGNDGGDED
jgi:hypothetical protein